MQELSALLGPVLGSSIQDRHQTTEAGTIKTGERILGFVIGKVAERPVMFSLEKRSLEAKGLSNVHKHLIKGRRKTEPEPSL